MPLGSIISAGASLLGARAQSRAAERAAQVQQQQFEQIRSDLEPYREAGVRGLSQYEDALGQPDVPLGLAEYSRGFQESPGYQYRLQEGQDAIQNSAAGRGMLQSGRTLRGLQTHAQGLANQDYWNYVGQNRLGALDRHAQRQDRLGQLRGLSTIGQNAAVQTGAAGQTAASNIGNAYQSAGNARASGFTGFGNAINSGLDDTSLGAGYRVGRRS